MVDNEVEDALVRVLWMFGISYEMNYHVIDLHLVIARA